MVKKFVQNLQQILTDRLHPLIIAYIARRSDPEYLLTTTHWDNDDSPSWSVLAAAISEIAYTYCSDATLLPAAVRSCWDLGGHISAASTLVSIKIKITAFVAFLC